MMLSIQDGQRGSFLGLVTGEPRETETLMRGSEAGRQEKCHKVTRWLPTLLTSRKATDEVNDGVLE